MFAKYIIPVSAGNVMVMTMMMMMMMITIRIIIPLSETER